jgi:16S rRNA (uracil1498-N3)-methyltransferase
LNSFIVFENQFKDNSLLSINGERLRHLKAHFKIETGFTIQASIFNGSRGVIKILNISEHEIVAEFTPLFPPIDRCPVIAIVATPRPQAIKRILQFATLAGIQAVYFVKAEYTEKSYLSSKELEEEKYKQTLVLALEQGYDSTPPQIIKQYSLEKSVEHILQNAIFSKNPLLFFTAHTDPSLPTFDTFLKKHQLLNSLPFSMSFLIGPEKGWSESEIRYFKDKNFDLLSLGQRIHRVDTAFYLLSSLTSFLYKS